jgi:hypothetical protein
MAVSRLYTYVSEMSYPVGALSCRMSESNFNVFRSTLNLSPCDVTWCPSLSVCFYVLFNTLFLAFVPFGFVYLCVSENINNLMIGFHVFLSVNPTSLLILLGCNIVPIASWGAGPCNLMWSSETWRGDPHSVLRPATASLYNWRRNGFRTCSLHLDREVRPVYPIYTS